MGVVQSHAYCKDDVCAKNLFSVVDHFGTWAAGNEVVNCNVQHNDSGFQFLHEHIRWLCRKDHSYVHNTSTESHSLKLL